MREVSYEYDVLHSLFYDLVRDASPGLIEKIMQGIENEVSCNIDEIIYSNNHISTYAKELANRLRKVTEGYKKNHGPCPVKVVK